MAAILLDTSVIFDHLNGRYGRTAYLEQLGLHFPMPELQLLPLPGSSERT